MDGFYIYLSSDASEREHPNNTKASFTTQLGEAIELDPKYLWSVALCEVIFPLAPGAVRKLDLSDETRGPIFVYTDIVTHSRVGDSSSRMLRIVSNTDPHQKFSQRYYTPLKCERISDISILFTDRLGDKYPFNKSVNPIIVVLHFAFSPRR